MKTFVFERARHEWVLNSLRQDFPQEGRKPITELSDDALLAEVDYLMGKAWSQHYLK